MSDIQWQQLETPVFDEERPDDVRVLTAVAEVKTEGAAKLLLDPRPELMKAGFGVDESWTVSLNRVNAEQPVPYPPMGPRKIVAVWTLFESLRLAHGVMYRITASETEQAS